VALLLLWHRRGRLLAAPLWSVCRLLLPAALTFSVGFSYTLFRPQLKNTLKRIEQVRLQKNIGKVQMTMTRTKAFVHDARVAGGDAEQGSSNTIDIEEEFGQVLETMRRVEAELEDLCQRARAVALHATAEEEQPRVECAHSCVV